MEHGESELASLSSQPERTIESVTIRIIQKEV